MCQCHHSYAWVYTLGLAHQQLVQPMLKVLLQLGKWLQISSFDKVLHHFSKRSWQSSTPFANAQSQNDHGSKLYVIYIVYTGRATCILHLGQVLSSNTWMHWTCWKSGNWVLVPASKSLKISKSLDLLKGEQRGNLG